MSKLVYAGAVALPLLGAVYALYEGPSSDPVIEINSFVMSPGSRAAGDDMIIRGEKFRRCPEITLSWGWQRLPDGDHGSVYSLVIPPHRLPNLPPGKFERVIEIPPPENMPSGQIRVHGELNYGGSGCERAVPVTIYGPWIRWPG